VLGEAVGLVADALEDAQAGVVAGQHPTLEAVPPPRPCGIKFPISPSRPFGPPVEHENASMIIAKAYRITAARERTYFLSSWSAGSWGNKGET
jgi:hypothetical protein